MGRSALGDLKFVGRPLGLRLRQGQDKRVALLVFLHFYPAFEMLSQFRDAFQIGFLDDDFYGIFGAPELAPDHARLEPQHEIRVAAGKSRSSLINPPSPSRQLFATKLFGQNGQSVNCVRIELRFSVL